MKYVYFRPLRDEELRHHLENGDMITFTDAVKNWEAIERQVERLGFEDAYAVSRSTKPYFAGLQHHTRVSPLRLPPRTLPRLEGSPWAIRMSSDHAPGSRPHHHSPVNARAT